MIGKYLRYVCNHHQKDWDTLLTFAEFAYNSAQIQHMNISPFALDLRWRPKSPLDLIGHTDSSIGSLYDLSQILSCAGSDATFAHRLAQLRQSAYNNKKDQPPNYKIRK